MSTRYVIYVLLFKKCNLFNRLLYVHKHSTLKIKIEFSCNLPHSASVTRRVSTTAPLDKPLFSGFRQKFIVFYQNIRHDCGQVYFVSNEGFYAIIRIVNI